MKHLLVTQDFPPDLGGMARRHAELVSRFGESMAVSTVAAPGNEAADRAVDYQIDRQPFPFSAAKRFTNQMRWAHWLVGHAKESIQVLHCGNIRPVGYTVWWAHKRLRLPYIVYVYGGDLLREQKKAKTSWRVRTTARLILGDAAGIVTISPWAAGVTRQLLRDIGVTNTPPIATIDLGTDPSRFYPQRDRGTLRARWGVGRGPLLITVARLVPHKGQDVAIRALARLRKEFPTLRYVLIGEGADEARLRNLAADLDVMDLVGFAGAMRDDELPEAYATATIYLGLSRIDSAINAEGFGISFVEASASGLPVVAGDSGGVRAAVRDGETGIVVDPTDVDAVVAAVGGLLRDEQRRRAFSAAGRHAAVTYYNWDRVARETLEFTHDCVGHR